jgi:altronate dehydratase large subunit
MDSPGHDGEVVTGFVGAGAQVVVFTSGRGTPTGFPFVPVIKITGNSFTFEKMMENIDVNAGTIITENIQIETKGKEIFDLLIEVSNGKETKAEILGHDELFCITRV